MSRFREAHGKDYDRATDFEEIGWKTATMADDLWAQVNGEAYML